ncbi:MAG: hypothetical protein R3C05_12535 [Pirellulaceae bacterium]
MLTLSSDRRTQNGNPGSILGSGRNFTLAELNYNASTGGITIWASEALNGLYEKMSDVLSVPYPRHLFQRIYAIPTDPTPRLILS